MKANSLLVCVLSLAVASDAYVLKRGAPGGTGFAGVRPTNDNAINNANNNENGAATGGDAFGGLAALFGLGGGGGGEGGVI